MTGSAEEWLAARSSGVPQGLQDLMIRAVEGRAGRTADALLEAACDLLDGVLEAPEPRRSALLLLAADALLTYAFEAAAGDADVEIESFARSAGVEGRLGRMAATLER